MEKTYKSINSFCRRCGKTTQHKKLNKVLYCNICDNKQIGVKSTIYYWEVINMKKVIITIVALIIIIGLSACTKSTIRGEESNLKTNSQQVTVTKGDFIFTVDEELYNDAEYFSVGTILDQNTNKQYIFVWVVDGQAGGLAIIER